MAIEVVLPRLNSYKIIKNTDSPTIKFQYQTLLGIKYMLMGVEEKAINEINKAISYFYTTEEEKDNSYTYIIWGRAYYALGILENSTIWYSFNR